MRKLVNRIRFGSYPVVFVHLPTKRLEYLFNLLRLKCWTQIAKRTGAFTGLYRHAQVVTPQRGTGERHLLEPSNSVAELANSVRVNGVGYLPNFLTPHDLEEVRACFRDIHQDSRVEQFGEGVRCVNKALPKSALDLFHRASMELSSDLLGKPVRLDSVGMQRLVLHGTDQGDPNTLLHIDRFLPCIKMFYFPDAVSDQGSPFGYVPRSHITDSNYLNSVRKRFHLGISSNAPFEIENRFGDEVPLTVPENTFVVSYTNGLHRRIPFSGSVGASRDSLRFIFYRSYAGRDLLRGCLRERYRSSLSSRAHRSTRT